MSLRRATLEVAAQYRDVQEIGTNRGPEVEMFQRAAGLHPGAPWCAAFVNYCAQEAARKLGMISPLESVPLQGYVPSYVTYGTAHDWLVTFNQVRPGDLFCIWSSKLSRYSHIGFVEGTTANSFMTIEGNSNDEGSHEGKEVCCNVRLLKARTCFLRWTRIVLPVVKK